jgi:hypothetical protein
MKLLIMQYSPASRTVLRPNILHSTLFSNSVILCSSISVRDKLPHPYEITGVLSRQMFVPKHLYFGFTIIQVSNRYKQNKRTGGSNWLINFHSISSLFLLSFAPQPSLVLGLLHKIRLNFLEASQQFSFLQGRVVSPTPNPHPGGPDLCIYIPQRQGGYPF